jgi:hypothetical protein
MYESRKHPLLPWPQFLRRLALHIAGAVALVIGSLLVGVGGYVYFENHGWHDAFLNATMMLGGMGPLAPPLTNGGKIFIGMYALYVGLVFIAAITMVLAPVAHRLLHKFHWDADVS